MLGLVPPGVTVVWNCVLWRHKAELLQERGGEEEETIPRHGGTNAHAQTSAERQTTEKYTHIY